MTYDSYGRTTSYLGKSISYSYETDRFYRIESIDGISFTYYENDLRRTKTVNGVTHYYTYEGINLVKEEWGGNVMLFLYDADGSVIGMQYRNSTYASGVWDTYYYEKNLQGDIVAVYSETGTKLVSYRYDAWGNFTRTDLASNVPDAVKNNPITYRGYYYDDDLDLYYLATRYYDPETCRFVTADDPAYIGANGDLLSYNLFAYCMNNPVNMSDPTGNWPSWSNLLKGSAWLAVGITAVCVGVSVLTCGVAAPAMVAVAAVTVGAGALTAVNGAAEIGEAFTGYNVVRDTVFSGNQKAYDAYANTTAAVAEVGTAVCGGWLKSSSTQTKIADKTLQNVIDNPNSVTKLSTDKFHKIANKSSWEFKPTQNNKGYRALKGDMSIRYNMNGTRFDAAHFGGSPYWVISSAKNGTIKIMMP